MTGLCQGIFAVGWGVAGIEDKALGTRLLLTVIGRQCTVEVLTNPGRFGNELNQLATHPTTYFNAHHGHHSQLAGSIESFDECMWKPFTKEGRKKDLAKLATYKKTL